MGDYSKFNIVYRLQKWMDSVPGQTFLNYAYSWGASIVILGTLFKLTHLPGANLMLFLGMGTEVLVFFLSAFDRPFDKTADGRDIPTHITEEYLETGKVTYDTNNSVAGSQPVSGSHPVSGDAVVVGQPIVFAPGATASQGIASAATSEGTASSPVSAAASSVSASSSDDKDADVAVQQPQSAAVQQPVAGSTAWVGGQQQITPEMEEAQNNYVEELKKLVETLEKVNEQSSRLTRDSEEMENLNRTLTGISKVYEMQLKGASQQIGTIDQINEQSRKMAQQIEQLNKIYTRMIEAMTVNMRAAAPHVSEE
ncbi:gliding motility protein GldL [Prevotella sp. AM42-24]|jgi:gliding motility-associated protein GldL|uniref:type IX secretion system motor protein PorL/GldL n=1 Tax=Prevotella sp. AM42-24 TaxID=2293125 RepID=UPI000E52E94C|nr:gliding motility protein GldL [Prevotella sp. AM42-24]MBD8971534.1 gliding motility protein GldL [Prevotella sp.]MBD9272889.1 gliding motility protein GldL [Prevotella sp.]RGH42851.1 gliding motility protein GldL [Prevotella sp. AM42-24]